MLRKSFFGAAMSFYFYVTYMILKDSLPYKVECTVISSSKPVFPYPDVVEFLQLEVSKEVMIMTWQPILKAEVAEFVKTVKFADPELSPKKRKFN